jgi:protein SCO1/2
MGPWLLLASLAPFAQAAPAPMQEMGLEDRLGQRVPLDLPLRDAGGREVKLGDFFGEKPVVLVFAYYRCPMLCGLVLRQAAQVTRRLEWRAGDEYRLLTVSFDPQDTPTAASSKQSATIEAAGLSGEPDRWPFLVAGAPSIERLTGALGFRYRRDAATRQFAHPAVVFVLSPDGMLSRVLDGLDYDARDLKLALLEAGRGQIGTALDRALLACFRYDPATRRYGPYVFGFLRAGAVVILALVVTFLTVLWVRSRRRAK